MQKRVFISHRSIDKDIADMLLDFFIATGLPKDLVFCSSLPGNDIKHKVSEEIKHALVDSCISIVILSNDYYQSAYCLNEAGVIWFQDVPVIIVAMPEIAPSKMIGFLNDEYRLRYLENESDIAAIYDQITAIFGVSQTSATSLTYAMNKLKSRYAQYIEKRANTTLRSTMHTIQVKDNYDEITTDDEQIILYYMLTKKIRKVTNTDVEKWLTENEIYNVNVANAFDLLSAAGWGTSAPGEKQISFELEISHFRKLSIAPSEITNPLKEAVIQHRRLSKDWFIAMWDTGQFDDSDLLFIAYIRDENVFSYGDRWMAEGQVENIKCWASKHSLETPLPADYSKCLGKFIENNFVFESSWTSYGNPREYSLHKSLKSYLLGEDFPYTLELKENKEKYYFELPF